ncbi:hypothetical protein BJ878DRAFT_259921 [Calycina marina]|uniref:Uncharacterized protein n=1 Tax=Calycina marina TaxID=1763456 RepID=A0A9P8CBS8_9HELO|nr:hypothetical protein BJ878DRAFT_259921 [Calycina marina]
MPSIAQTPPRLESKKRRRDEDMVQMAYLHNAHAYEANENIHPDQEQWQPCHIAAKPIRYPSKRLRVSSPNVALSQYTTTPDITSKSPYKRHPDSAAREEVEKAIDLTPCHFCRRRPSSRIELDQYSNCEGCGARTCYICMRECEGLAVVTPGMYLEGDYDRLACSFERRGMIAGEDNRDGGGKFWEKRAEHRQKVCRDCCVEIGSEGEARCLGCYRVGKP